MVLEIERPTQYNTSRSAYLDVSRVSIFVEETKNADGFFSVLEEYRLRKNLKPGELYRKASLGKQLYSKIKNMAKTDYCPKKSTVIAFGLALESTEEEMRASEKRGIYTLP
jgi:tRNA(Ile)-lysidine synthase TilS/MesJ